MVDEIVLTEKHMAILLRFRGRPDKYISRSVGGHEQSALDQDEAWQEIERHHLISKVHQGLFCIAEFRWWGTFPIVLTFDHITLLETFEVYPDPAATMSATIRDIEIINSAAFQELIAWRVISSRSRLSDTLYIINPFYHWLS